MMNPLIEQFIDQILKEAQLETLPPDFKQEYKLRLGEELEKRIGVETIKLLNNDQLKQLDTMLTEKKGMDAEKVSQFFAKQIPNYDQIMGQKMLEFKDMFVAQAKAQKSAQASGAAPTPAPKQP